MTAKLTAVPPALPEVPDLLKVRTARDEAALRAVLPAEMLDLPRWNTWRGSVVARKDGTPKLNKQPKSGRALSWGSTKVPSTWGTGPQALAVLRQADKCAAQSDVARRGGNPECAPDALHGLGFNLARSDGAPECDVWGIDLDRCRDPATGKASAEAQAIIDAAQTYTESTPGGLGFRLFGRGGEVSALHDFCGAGVEFYRGDEARYLTVTGACIAHPRTLAPMSPALAQLLAPHVTAAPRKGEAPPLPPGDTLPQAEWDDLVFLTGAQGDALTLIKEGLPAGDRSPMVFGLVCRLLEAHVEPAVVYQFLLSSPGIWDYALSKRQGHTARAQALLWAEVQKAHRKTDATGPDAPKSPLQLALERLNERYFVADEQGKIFVCTMQPDRERNDREVLVRYTFKAFQDKYRREQFNMATGTGTRLVPLGREWLRWAQGRQYDRITFNPRGDSPPEVFNLWRGWAVEAAPGDWSLVHNHIEGVVCSGSKELTRYVLGWLAFLVQRPWERPETALILRGEEGAGKSIFGDAVRRLAGAHSMQVSNPRHLIGNFNEHLRNCIVLQADEALFAGNHEHNSILKSMITDPDFVIEGKGLTAFLSKNYLHIIMTSNERWVVPAGLEARRFVVLDVSEARRGDSKYFGALAAAIKDDRVLAAMLHDLQRWSLADFNVRKAPDTAGLREQKLRSLDGLNGWLADLLTAGELPTARGTHLQSGWRPFYTSRELRASYHEWVGSRQRRERVLSDVTLGKELSGIFPWYRRAPALDNTVDEGCPGYRFGTLTEARARFCERTGVPPSTFDNVKEEYLDDILS